VTGPQEPTARDVIESAIEIGDPSDKLGVARTIAAAVLADLARVRRLLRSVQAEALLLAAARTLKKEES
jgi:hypothetical protein